MVYFRMPMAKRTKNIDANSDRIEGKAGMGKKYMCNYVKEDGRKRIDNLITANTNTACY